MLEKLLAITKALTALMLMIFLLALAGITTYKGVLLIWSIFI